MYRPKCKAPHDTTVQCIFFFISLFFCFLFAAWSMLSLVLFTCVLGIPFVTQFVQSQWDV